MKRNFALAAYGAADTEGRSIAGRRVDLCMVGGCNNVAVEAGCCRACSLEWEALLKLDAEREQRRAARRERRELRFKTGLEVWLACCDWARGVDWIGNALLGFIACSLSYLGYVYGSMLLEWLGGR
jgi:hypothetical protein